MFAETVDRIQNNFSSSANNFSIENILSRSKVCSTTSTPLSQSVAINCSSSSNSRDRLMQNDFDKDVNEDTKLSESETYNNSDNLKFSDYSNDTFFETPQSDDENNTSGRKKRPRTAFSAPQIKVLESEFEKGKYLSVAKRTSLSKQLHLSETQIKIWFQNRRTKWKRKYTADVESLASHYYAHLGIGGIARPMVVGDRLWLFSQTATGLILNNRTNIGMNPLIQSYASNISMLTNSTTSPSTIPSTSSLISPSDVVEDDTNPQQIQSKSFAYNQPHLCSNKLIRSVPTTNYIPSHIDTGLKIPTSSSLFSSHDYTNIQFENDLYLQHRFNLEKKIIQNDSDNGNYSSNGIAELERVFGNRNPTISPNCTEQKLDKTNNKLILDENQSREFESNFSYCSDVDCEEL